MDLLDKDPFNDGKVRVDTPTASHKMLDKDTCALIPLLVTTYHSSQRPDYQSPESIGCFRSTMHGTAAERGGNTLHASKDFRAESGSSQGQILALAGLFVPSSLNSGGQGILGSWT